MWTRYAENFRGWCVTEDGYILASTKSSIRGIESIPRPDESWLYRTKGHPSTMEQLLADYGPIIREASELFNVPVQTICGMIAIEASRMKTDKRRFDPRSIRLEPGYESDKHTPHRVSPGLGQTLLTTANQMLKKVPEFSHEVAVDRQDLFIPNYSIKLSTAYIRHQMDRFESDEVGNPEDPIFNAVAAYNAGSVKPSNNNPWGLLTHAEGRIDKFIAYSNDARTLLA